jgi:hypothetical protein
MKKSQHRIGRVEDERLFEVPYRALRVSFDEKVGPRVEQASEQVGVLALEGIEHAFELLLELFLLAGLFIMLGYAVSPEGFERAALDRASLREVLYERVQHRVIVKPAGRLAVNKVEHYLESLVRALER